MLKKNQFFPTIVSHSFLFFLLLGTVSCITSEEKTKMQSDIFDLRTKVLDLNSKLLESGQNRQDADKKIAHVHTTADQLNQELAKITGELDRLKSGVVTGELPGADGSEKSIKKLIEELSDRVKTLEETQIEIITLLEKQKQPAEKTSPKKEKIELSNLKDMQIAFKKKHYQMIVVEGPNLLKKSKKSENYSEMKYLYAESLFKLGKHTDAALEFSELLKAPPKNLTAQIYLRLGDNFRILGDSKAALAYYHDLVEKFPKAAEVKQAKAHMEKLGKNG